MLSDRSVGYHSTSAEERRIRSERIKEGWRKRKERLAREKEALTLVKANH